MKSVEYWAKRSEQIAARQFKRADDYDQEQRREYERATMSIKRDIEAFYARFAKNNEIDMAEVRKLLTTGELKEFKMTLKEFTAKAKSNADGQWTKELNNVYIRTRVSRLEALQVQINQQVEMLAGKRQVGTGALLGGVYKDTYYRTLYELQKGTGIGVSFARIDDDGMKTVLGAKLDGRNWSQRIWDDRTKLRQELQTKLSQSFIRGDSVDRTIKDVTERMNVSRSNAERLVQTESAFFTGQATMAGYKESEVVQKYEVLATLDSRTTPICREMDGKVFPLSEMQVGVNYPPFHVRCRTTTVPYFDDEIDPGERIARDTDGKSYYVPGDITYGEWEKKYVLSSVPPESGTINFKPQFSEIISKLPNQPAGLAEILDARFASGTETAQSVFTKYVQDNVIEDGAYKAGAHYNPVEKAIFMDLNAELDNPRGNGATFFHEVGHYVDNMAAIKLTGKQTYDGVSHIPIGSVAAGVFKKAIMQDVDAYLKNYARENRLSLREAQERISADLGQGDGGLHSAVSDLYGGATSGQIQGKYGHRKDYWRQLPNALEKEAFAHMFEASFDPAGKRAALIKEYLPSAFQVFYKILEEI